MKMSAFNIARQRRRSMLYIRLRGHYRLNVCSTVTRINWESPKNARKHTGGWRGKTRDHDSVSTCGVFCGCV